MDQGFLIVGLGNPGRKYRETRHNAGFMVVEELARRWQADWTLESAFQSRLARAQPPVGTVWLCQPQTYMNLSGDAVGSLTAYYRVPLNRLLVVVDDADLPLGTVRLRPRGSSGGHHGIESIEARLGSREFARQRLGIGRSEPGEREITAHVLSRFRAEEQALWRQILERAADQAVTWCHDGAREAMNRFNGSVISNEPTGTKDN